MEYHDDELSDIEIPETLNLANSIEPDNAAINNEERQLHILCVKENHLPILVIISVVNKYLVTQRQDNPLNHYGVKAVIWVNTF